MRNINTPYVIEKYVDNTLSFSASKKYYKSPKATFDVFIKEVLLTA